MTIFLRLQLKALMLEAGRTLKGEYLSSTFKTSGLNSSATKLKTKFKKKYIRKKQIFSFFFFFFFDFQDRVLLCSPGFPGACSVNQAGLKTQRSACRCLPSAGMHHHHPADADTSKLCANCKFHTGKYHF